jgi:hypothetical protein
MGQSKLAAEQEIFDVQFITYQAACGGSSNRLGALPEKSIGCTCIASISIDERRYCKAAQAFRSKQNLGHIS